MENKQPRPRSSRRSWLEVLAAALCAASAVVTLLAIGNWFSGCQDGVLNSCLDGKPSFELVFQVILAVLASTFAAAGWFLAKNGSRAAALAALVLVVVLFAGWALFLDAAVHGWDDLKYAAIT